MVVMSLRVPQSCARRWQTLGRDWRTTLRNWMLANAPKDLKEELAELEAARARGAGPPPEPELDEF